MKEIARMSLSGGTWAYNVTAVGYEGGSVALFVDGKEQKFTTALEAAEYGDSVFGRRSLLGNQAGTCLVSVATQMGAIPYGWNGWDNQEARR